MKHSHYLELSTKYLSKRSISITLRTSQIITSRHFHIIPCPTFIVVGLDVVDVRSLVALGNIEKLLLYYLPAFTKTDYDELFRSVPFEALGLGV